MMTKEQFRKIYEMLQSDDEEAAKLGETLLKTSDFFKQNNHVYGILRLMEVPQYHFTPEGYLECVWPKDKYMIFLGGKRIKLDTLDQWKFDKE